MRGLVFQQGRVFCGEVNSTSYHITKIIVHPDSAQQHIHSKCGTMKRRVSSSLEGLCSLLNAIWTQNPIPVSTIFNLNSFLEEPAFKAKKDHTTRQTKYSRDLCLVLFLHSYNRFYIFIFYFDLDLGQHCGFSSQTQILCKYYGLTLIGNQNMVIMHQDFSYTNSYSIPDTL